MQAVAKPAERPSTPLAQFVGEMRAIAPFGTIDWDDDTWDVTDAPTRAAKRSHDKKRYRLIFKAYDPVTRAYSDLSEPYAQFSKAVICQRHNDAAQTPGAHRVSIRALRYLFAALCEDGRSKPEELRIQHFHAAETLAVAAEKQSSAYRVSQHLEQIARVIERRQLAKVRISYRATLRRSETRSIPAKMLTDEEIDTCGDLCAAISADKERSAADIIRMRVADICVSGGMRIGEVLTLPENTEVNDAEGYGLGYWPEKGGQILIRRVPTPAIEIVKRAIEDLRTVCAGARQMARWLHDNPGRVYFPPNTPEELTYEEAASLLGITAWAVKAFTNKHRLRSRRDWSIPGGLTFVSREDLERALVSLRDDRLVIDAPGVYRQRLHESLIVAFRHEMKPDARTMRQLVEPVNIQQISYFLGTKNGGEATCAFKRYDIRLANGQHPRITTHRFRHWLNTLALRGGMNELELARWMGRRQIRDNAAYDHRTTAERAEEARQLIRDGKVAGAFADFYESLPTIEEKEHFLQTHVTAALMVPNGGCLHDWAQTPCKLHLSCLSGCPEYYRTIGSVREREALKRQRADTQVLLERARAEVDEQTCGAGNWVAHLEIQLKNIDKGLAVDADLFDEGEA
ncbi:MAG TPA: hypothetical protein VMB26_01585 [Candidatus Binataceae bacterium]|nr:hypothetical protein [Candidatus Binataceae bacterium]